MKAIFCAFMLGLLIAPVCFSKQPKHSHKDTVQFSATDAEVQALNQRLNEKNAYGPSLYFRDPGSPYDPVSPFNMSYCANSPNDPGCYYSRGMQFGIAW